MNEFLTVKDAVRQYAGRVPASYRSFARWASSGRFPTERIGGRMIVRRDDFERFLEAVEG